MTELESGKLLPTKILAKLVEAKEEKIGSGLLIKPVTVKDPNIRATVLKVGTGTSSVEMSVAVSNQIIFSPHAAQRLRLEDEDYVITDVRDVLFIIPK